MAHQGKSLANGPVGVTGLGTVSGNSRRHGQPWGGEAGEPRPNRLDNVRVELLQNDASLLQPAALLAHDANHFRTLRDAGHVVGSEPVVVEWQTRMAHSARHVECLAETNPMSIVAPLWTGRVESFTDLLHSGATRETGLDDIALAWEAGRRRRKWYSWEVSPAPRPLMGNRSRPATSPDRSDPGASIDGSRSLPRGVPENAYGTFPARRHMSTVITATQARSTAPEPRFRFIAGAEKPVWAITTPPKVAIKPPTTATQPDHLAY